MKAIAVLIILFSTYMIYFLWRDFRRGRTSVANMLSWSTIWLIVLVFSAFPKLLDIFMNWTMMTQRMNFIFVISIFGLLIIVTHMFKIQKKHIKEICSLSQEIAVLKYAIEYKDMYDDRDRPCRTTP